ncbi:MAG: tRNA 2-thiocytidine(32) synthetase TtcA [Deltaproteobacteria bacterium]|nr:tRNA 2-thiocytidine(32) synthetase TtcA [Deltaproteobacteria bacterium]
MKEDGLFFFTSKKVGKAIWDYKMIKDNDRILVAVSGGKDSLSMLKILKERVKFVPQKYVIIACFVDMGFEWIDKEKLTEFFNSESIDFVIATPPETWKGPKESFDCFWCSWNRRKALFDTAQRLNCTKIALGHHMDDIIETMMLNLFFNGEISTMRPYQEMFGGELAIIRPLAYVEEKNLEKLSSVLALPVIKSMCPNKDISRRKKMKEIIREIELINPDVKKNIFRSLKRIKKEYLL